MNLDQVTPRCLRWLGHTDTEIFGEISRCTCAACFMGLKMGAMRNVDKSV